MTNHLFCELYSSVTISSLSFTETDSIDLYYFKEDRKTKNREIILFNHKHNLKYMFEIYFKCRKFVFYFKIHLIFDEYMYCSFIGK